MRGWNSEVSLYLHTMTFTDPWALYGDSLSVFLPARDEQSVPYRNKSANSVVVCGRIAFNLKWAFWWKWRSGIVEKQCIYSSGGQGARMLKLGLLFFNLFLRSFFCSKILLIWRHPPTPDLPLLILLHLNCWEMPKIKRLLGESKRNRGQTPINP